MSKGIIVAGFGAIGKTTLQQKYKDVIDMESGMYQWDNVGFEDIPYEKRKGTTDRKRNKEWLSIGTENFDTHHERKCDRFPYKKEVHKL